MRIRNIQLAPYTLPLRQPWRSSHFTLSERSGLLVVVHDEQGQRGYGDCAPFTAVSGETLAQARAWLQQQIATLPGQTAEQSLQQLPEVTQAPRAARCALECALLDLLARQQALPLSRFLSTTAAAVVSVNASLGDLHDVQASQLAALKGYSVAKLKVGRRSVPEDLARLRQLVAGLPAGVRLRLDANRAWCERDARAFIEGIAGLPIESLEEPLAAPDVATLAALQAATPFPLALDESLLAFTAADILARRGVQRLVLKPMWLGGLRASLDLARRAQDAGMDCVVTTSLDSAIGSHAALHLAAAVDTTQAPVSHGLATSDWLSQDLAPAPRVHNAQLAVGPAPGLGIDACDEALRGSAAPPYTASATEQESQPT